MPNTASTEEQEIDLIELFQKLLSHWKWFIISLTIALTGAFLYLQFSIPVYQTTASIVIKDTENQNKAIDELFAMTNTQLPNMGTQIEDEIEILRSRSILLQIIDELHLYTSYKVKKGIRYTEDTEPALEVSLDKSTIENLSGTLSLQIEKQEEQYNVWIAQNDVCREETITSFPALIETPAGKLTLRMTGRKWNGTMKVFIDRPTDAAKRYSQQLTVGTASKKTSIISLSFTDTNKKRAENFLSKLIEIYNRDAMNDKNKVTGNTLVFIEERLDSISHELGFVEKNIERYKLQERLSDIKTNMMIDLNTNNEYEKKLLDVETQLNMTTYIHNYLQDKAHRFSLLPINTGIADTELAKQINEYNKELLERERLLHVMKEGNPSAINQDMKTEAIRRNIISSVLGVRDGLLMARDEIRQKTNYFDSRIKNLPKQEREFNNIDRQQQIKANLYLMLLERREQASISLAATINKARVIDAPLAADIPVSPKRMMIYAGSGFLALVLTAGIVLFGGIFRTKLESVSEVEAIGLPLAGVIPQISSDAEVVENQNKVIDEAFRRIRSNLRFIAENENRKCILVTSTLSGEGKSFVCINLALTFAFLKCKVLIVGLDIRRPRLAAHFGIQSKLGFTNYLSDNSMELEDIIFPSGTHPYLSVVPSGPIPPNPAEQLEKEKLKEAFAYFRQHFDYIIVDSAPVGMVSDTLSLGKVTDYTLYVCRLNYTDKKALSMITELQASGQLNNISLLVNSTKLSDVKYGYGYGYGEKRK